MILTGVAFKGMNLFQFSDFPEPDKFGSRLPAGCNIFGKLWCQMRALRQQYPEIHFDRLTGGIRRGITTLMNQSAACAGAQRAWWLRAARARGVLWVLAAMLAVMLPVAKGSADESTGQDKPDLWNVTIGSWAVLEPKFEGARHNSFAGRPILNVRKEGSRDWLVLPNDGFDFELFETDNFRAGPVANWHWQRDVGGSAPRGFRHIGSVDLSVEAGAFAEFWPSNYLRTRVEMRHSVIGGKGIVADLTADGVWRPRPDLVLTAGPRISVADSDFMHAYYTIGPAQQNAAFNLPAYDAKAGLRSVGAGSMIKYNWTEQWATMSFIEFQRLAGSAGDSPVITSHGTRDQVSVGVGLSYSFSVGR